MTVHLIVEIDVPHVAVDAGVAADPELANAARPFSVSSVSIR